MIYVINLEDGGGEEFFFTVGGKCVKLKAVSDEQPQEFKTHKAAERKMDQYSEKYPAVCRLYPVELNEFKQRRIKLQTTASDAP